MDVLKPPTVWINGTCYRKPAMKDPDLFQSGGNGGDAADEYGNDDYEQFDDYEEEEDQLSLNNDIRQLENGQFRLSFHVASAFFALIIGKKGATKKRIEMETKTRIAIPRMGAEGDITVTGERKQSVAAAHNRIRAMVDSARDREDFTHFVSIPLNTEEMQNAFAKFRQEILGGECSNARGVDETVFQDPGMLHLTVLTLVLMDNQERQRAVELLEDCKERVLLPLLGESAIAAVKVAGLEIMNDDPGEADVVYAKVTSDHLQSLADGIVTHFATSGLVSRQQHQRVKLHATLMNTLFRGRREEDQQEGEGGSNSRRRNEEKRVTLDARPILERFVGFQFGEVSVAEIHLSQRRGGRRTESGYYFPSAVVKFDTCG